MRVPARLLRPAVQAAFFAGFVYVFLSLQYPVAMPYASPALAADPLLAAAELLFYRGSWLPALALPAAFVVATALLGRAFCGWACPVGFLCDLAARVRRGRSGSRFGGLQYGALAAVLVLSLFSLDWLAVGDPLVLFGRSEYLLYAAAGAPAALLLIAGSALVVERFWCRALCPLGGLLGAAALASPLRFRANERCIQCGKCGRACPMGALTEGLAWDATACTKCLACERACPRAAVSFAPTTPQVPSSASQMPSFSASRRSFLAGVAVLGTLAVARGAAAATAPAAAPIRPPGSLEEGRFNAACARCGACAKACSSGVIEPLGLAAGLERAFTPALDFDRAMCMRCGTCGQVCPTGAVISQPADKIKLGTAAIDAGLCWAWKSKYRCLVCSEVCPAHAIRNADRLQPAVAADQCMGCGSCQHNCPAEGKAIRVSSAGERRRS